MFSMDWVDALGSAEDKGRERSFGAAECSGCGLWEEESLDFLGECGMASGGEEREELF